jgi:hypothetical protein
MYIGIMEDKAGKLEEVEGVEKGREDEKNRRRVAMEGI